MPPARIAERPHAGTIAEDGVRANLRVGIQYLEAWLGGNGCVPLCNLMEDAATAELDFCSRRARGKKFGNDFRLALSKA